MTVTQAIKNGGVPHGTIVEFVKNFSSVNLLHCSVPGANLPITEIRHVRHLSCNRGGLVSPHPARPESRGQARRSSWQLWNGLSLFFFFIVGLWNCEFLCKFSNLFFNYKKKKKSALKNLHCKIYALNVNLGQSEEINPLSNPSFRHSTWQSCQYVPSPTASGDGYIPWLSAQLPPLSLSQFIYK